MNFVEFILNNFMHVAPIIACGIFAIGIIFERVKALFSYYPITDSKKFIQTIHELVLSRKIPEAINICEQYPMKPLAIVIKSALVRSNLPDEASEQAAALALSESSRILQSKTNFLATIANVATLLGLLGTIAGLIQSFEAVAHADPQQKTALLSAGIATAMNATMLGLAVAVPCMVAYSFLMNKTNALIGELEDGAAKAIDALKIRYFTTDDEEDKPKKDIQTIAA
jgi:biopolymer transport protein ExbB